MGKFDILFGMAKDSVKETCVVTPFLTKETMKGLGIGPLQRGMLYAAGSSRVLTLIRCGIGAGSAGDAILNLADTPCKKIFFFGACGLVRKKKGLNIGSMVTPVCSYSVGTFSEMLHGAQKKWPVSRPDKKLLKAVLSKIPSLVPVSCASVASLELETAYLPIFKKNKVGVVDMESSAVLEAARYIRRPCCAILYITDIIEEVPFYLAAKDPSLKSTVSDAINILSKNLCKLIENNVSF